MKGAVVHFLSSVSLLDHAAPLSYYLNLPLLLTEGYVNDALKKYYPQVKADLLEFDKIDYSKLLGSFDILFKTTLWNFKDDPLCFFAKLFDMQTIFAYFPHGNSDKGYHSNVMHPLILQDYALLYGTHMKERLQAQGIWDDVPPHCFCGNFRYSFYLEHKVFYDEIVEREIFSGLSREKKTILYAPTWEDTESFSSFFEFAHLLAKDFPSSSFNLIIKPHPSLIENHPGKYFSLEALFLEKKDVCVVKDFPLIYPLLEKVDIYLGDYSSIGYDFLIYERPMFFLDKHQRSKDDLSKTLHQAGMNISQNENSSILSFIEKNISPWLFKKKQKQLYSHAFGDLFCKLKLKQAVKDQYQLLKKKNL